MIYFYSGTPGSGKSLHVAETIYNKIRCGVNVIANFPINYDGIKPLFGKKKGEFIHVENCELSVGGLTGFARNFHVCRNGKMLEGQTWLVIDECQLLFNSRNWNSKSRSEWCSFFTQHRKYGFEVVLISQFDRLVDRQIRSLIEYEYRHRKINNFKTFGWLLGKLCGGNLFVCVELWYGMNEKICSNFFRGKKKYYALYNSYKLFDSVE